MISPEKKSILIEFGNTQYWKVLSEYLDDEISNIDSVSKCESWDDALGRKKAVEILKKIFSVIDGKKASTIKGPGQYT